MRLGETVLIMARILIADGDTPSRGYIHRILSKRQIGQSVGLTGDGFCAYASLLSNEYDLAIIDASLPNFSIDSIRKLRARGVQTKIVVLCELASPRLAREVVLSGAQDLVEKPILLDSFVYSLKRHLDKNRSDVYADIQSANWPRSAI